MRDQWAWRPDDSGGWAGLVGADFLCLRDAPASLTPEDGLDSSFWDVLLPGGEVPRLRDAPASLAPEDGLNCSFGGVPPAGGEFSPPLGRPEVACARGLPSSSAPAGSGMERSDMPETSGGWQQNRKRRFSQGNRMASPLEFALKNA